MTVTHLAGVLLPESTLSSTWFAVLAAFVAINTVMYVTLAGAKILPRLHPEEWLPRTYVRSQTRSIHPDDGEGPDVARPPTVLDPRSRRARHAGGDSDAPPDGTPDARPAGQGPSPL